MARDERGLGAGFLLGGGPFSPKELLPDFSTQRAECKRTNGKRKKERKEEKCMEHGKQAGPAARELGRGSMPERTQRVFRNPAGPCSSSHRDGSPSWATGSTAAATAADKKLAHGYQCRVRTGEALNSSVRQGTALLVDRLLVEGRAHFDWSGIYCIVLFLVAKQYSHQHMIYIYLLKK